MNRFAAVVSQALLFAIIVASHAADSPRSLDDRVTITLFAEQPQIVTPTGLDVDGKGRVWALESNTHFRPEGYTGHASDRLLVLRDTDGDDRANEPTTFADGFTFAMSVLVWPVWLADEEGLPMAPGRRVFVATRKEIVLLYDDNGDLAADRRETIVRLETPGNYPHNGLAGLAIDPRGRLIFGLGENLGADYEVQAGGVSLKGGGEGGNIYRLNLHGADRKVFGVSGLTKIATGFWNPHASGFDALGRLFSVDNDPDSRPPCRLLHIVAGGDYGYRFRNGRKGLHPFTSWNGELPGTLPMTAGTGEAPSGVLAYRPNPVSVWALPRTYFDSLLATSWGDHRIDVFRLKPSGASFTSITEPLIVGGEDFRPVGIALAPDGSLYCTDWVKADYNLHGHGRVWRIAVKERDQSSLDIPFPNFDSLRWAIRSQTKTNPGRKQLEALVTDPKTLPRLLAEIGWAAIGKDEAILDTLLARKDAAAAAIDRQLDPYYFDPADPATHVGPGKHAAAAIAADPSTVNPEYLLAAYSHVATKKLSFYSKAPLDDPFIFAGVVARLASPEQEAAQPIRAALLDAKLQPYRFRLAIALAKLDDPAMRARALADSEQAIRRAAIQYVAEHNLVAERPAVAAILDDDALTADVFLATITALALLDGASAEKIDKTPAKEYVMPLVRDPSRPPAIRALALRLASPDDPALDETLMREFIGPEAGAELRVEAVRTLASSSHPFAAALLREVAANRLLDAECRADAIAGLASAALAEEKGGPTRELLDGLLREKDSAIVHREAYSSLGGTKNWLGGANPTWQMMIEAKNAGSESRPESIEAWRKALDEPAHSSNDPTPEQIAAGRRTFFQTNGAGCFKCHTVGGRGGPVGPDLTYIGRTATREKLIDSILAPSQEIAPQFVSWQFETEDGRVLLGMIVHENEGRTVIGDAEGKTVEIATKDVAHRTPQKISVMPQDLQAKLSLREFRELLAYLQSLR